MGDFDERKVYQAKTIGVHSLFKKKLSGAMGSTEEKVGKQEKQGRGEKRKGTIKEVLLHATRAMQSV